MSSEERRQQIIDGATEVLIEKGIVASRMNDFIEASGLSKGGVYHHFSSKEELMIGVLTHLLVINAESMQAIPDTGSAREQLILLLQEYEKVIASLAQYNRLLLDFFVLAPHTPEVSELFKQGYLSFLAKLSGLIQQGIDEGEFKASTNPEAIARGLQALYDGMGMTMMVVPDLVNFPSDANETAMAIIAGMCR